MKSRRWWVVGIATTLTLLPLAGLALLPPLFGEAPAVGVSKVEHSLCVLNADGSAGILVAGDSRAQYNLIPGVLEEMTGKRTVNVAQFIHLGGDPISLVNALRRRPDALAAHPTVILSVTIDEVNDLAFKGLPLVGVLNWGVADHLRVLWERQKAYPRFLVGTLLPGAARISRDRWKGEDFRCDAEVYRPPRVLAERGFYGYEGRRTEAKWSMPRQAEDYLLDGGQRKALRKALDWLAASEAGRIVLLNAPIDTAWLRNSDGDVPMAMQARFADLLREEAARHPKITYLDFFRDPIPELVDSLYYDPLHLNRRGAEVFSRHMGWQLRALELADSLKQ